MKFKVGDSVTIRKDLIIGKKYNKYISFVDRMMDYKGKKTTIKKIDRGHITLAIDGGYWNWAEDMLENPIINWRKKLQC